eukprot:Skav214936  [mRNA]  locus=scaffold3017:92598:93068:- [translate_table: standard]
MLPVMAIGALSLSGLATCLYATRSTEEAPIKARISSREVEYLCEGSNHLLCRVKQKDAFLLQFAKDSKGIFTDDSTKKDINDFARQRQMQQFLGKVFPHRCISIPQILSIPASDVRTIDAHLLGARSKAVRKQRLDIGSDIRVKAGRQSFGFKLWG